MEHYPCVGSPAPPASERTLRETMVFAGEVGATGQEGSVAGHEGSATGHEGSATDGYKHT